MLKRQRGFGRTLLIFLLQLFSCPIQGFAIEILQVSCNKTNNMVLSGGEKDNMTWQTDGQTTLWQHVLHLQMPRNNNLLKRQSGDDEQSVRDGGTSEFWARSEKMSNSDNEKRKQQEISFSTHRLLLLHYIGLTAFFPGQPG